MPGNQNQIRTYGEEALTSICDGVDNHAGKGGCVRLLRLKNRSGIRCMADTGGFTLVELIVVLTIMSIMAAYAVPAFLGFMDNIKEKQTLNNAKKAYMAAQSLAKEAGNDLVKPADRVTEVRMKELSGITWETGGAIPYSITYESEWNSSNPTKAMYEISDFQYTESGFTAKYDADSTEEAGPWTVSEASGS